MFKFIVIVCSPSCGFLLTRSSALVSNFLGKINNFKSVHLKGFYLRQIKGIDSTIGIVFDGDAEQHISFRDRLPREVKVIAPRRVPCLLWRRAIMCWRIQ